MIPINNRIKLFFNRIFESLFLENFFIACCAAALVLATFIINDLPVKLTTYSVFLFSSTFLVYNFHYLSFKIVFSTPKALINSALKIQMKTSLKIFLPISIGVSVILFFYLNFISCLLIFLLGAFAVAYSIPIIKWQNTRLKLREISIVKTPLIALVWGITTGLIPILEQNIRIDFSFGLMQVLCRSLFIFALCIPFEMRDLEKDKKSGIGTIAVIYGIKNSKIAGLFIGICAIIIHHLMPLSFLTMLSLDLAATTAMIWIVMQNVFDGKYFYKIFVDGTMLLLFILLLTAKAIS